MRRSTVLPLFAGGLLLAASCSNMDARVGVPAPTPVGADAAPNFSASESVVSTQAIRDPFCPSVGTFGVPIGLVIQAGDVGLFVTEIRMRFTDTFGGRMPDVTLPAPVMTTQFGSALVAARSARTFPLFLGIGCGIGRTGTVVIFVDTRDDRGRTRSGQVTVVVR